MKGAVRNFTGLVIVFGIFLCILLAGVFGNLRAGNYVVVPVLFTGLLLFVGAIWFSRYKVRVLLRDPAPSRLIDHYHQSLRRLPDAAAAASYLGALAATFFGDFARARQELEGIPDPGRRAYVLASLALLEDRDYKTAIALANEGKQKEDSPVLDEVIRTVAGEESESGIGRLERVARKQHGLLPAMAAWALAVYCKRHGKDDSAMEFKAILKDSVPAALPLK